MRYLKLFFFFFSIITTLPSAFANPLIETIVTEAKSKNLSADPTWRALLYYTNDGSPHSLVDDSKFFLSSTGKTNAEDELIATLQEFFKNTTDDQSAQCRFPARFLWLDKYLNFTTKGFPIASCRRFDDWYKTINPDSITLIFPSAFLNNPASSFGHTLLRIDQPGQKSDSKLLSYTASYAAAVNDDDNIISYALKGLFGGYVGYFTIEPYYDRLKQYGDSEQRDIWEYELDFTPEETRFLTHHLWELKEIGLNYYYFDDNCAYLLLAMLNIARPELDLTRTTKPWIIPVDTIRTVTARNGLVKNIIFRPAPATLIATRAKRLSSVEKQAVKSLVKPDMSVALLNEQNLTDAEKADTLEMSYDYLIYEGYKDFPNEDEYKARAFELLKTRSSIREISQPLDVPTPETRPDQGHDILRLRMFSSIDDEVRYGLALRPAYHDLLDPDGGFTRGSDLQMLALAATYGEDSGLQLEQLTLLRAMSLAPRSDFIKPLSWDITVELKREYQDNDDRPLGGFVVGGAGITYNLWQSAFFYSLFNVSSKFVDSPQEDWALGLNKDNGIVWHITPKLALNLAASSTYYGFGEKQWNYDFKAESRITLSRNNALRVNYRYFQDYLEFHNQVNVGWDFFF